MPELKEMPRQIAEEKADNVTCVKCGYGIDADYLDYCLDRDRQYFESGEQRTRIECPTCGENIEVIRRVKIEAKYWTTV